MKKYLRNWFHVFAMVAVVLVAILPLSVLQATASSVTDPSVNYSLCFPYAPKNNKGETGTLLITNAAAGAVTLNVSILAADGTQAAALPPASLDSGATKIVDLAALAGLSAGAYQVVAAAGGDLVGAAHIRSAGGSVGVYRAVDCAAEPDSVFGPFSVDNPDGVTSVLHVMNNSTSAAVFKLDFIDNNGDIVYSRPNLAVTPNGGIHFASDDVPTSVFGQEGYGRVQVTSWTSGVSGVLASKRNGITTYSNAMWGNQVSASSNAIVAMRNALPRLHNGSTDTGTSFTTQLFLVNAVNGANTTNMSFYRADGSQAATPRVQSFIGGDARLDASVMPAGPATASMVLGAQGPIAIQAEMVADGNVPAGQPVFSADSTVISAYSNSFLIPGVVYDGDVISIVAVQKMTGDYGLVGVELLNADGSHAATVSNNIQPGAALTVDLRNVQGVAQPFYGAARISGPRLYVGQLDIYSKLASSPLAQVKIEGADLAAAPGAAVDLTAVVSPTSSIKPITYTWQADEQAPQVHVTAASQDGVSFAWASPGLKTVRVTAANAGAMVAAEHRVCVPAASAVSVEGAPLTLTHAAADGVSLQLEVPVDAAAPGYTLTLTPLSSREIGAVNGAPAAATLIGTGALFDAFRGGQALPRFSFLAPAALRMRYTDADVRGFDEATLRIWTLQNGTWVDAADTCSAASQYVRRPELNEIEVPICHLSPYALGVPGKLLYLPALGRGQ